MLKKRVVTACILLIIFISSFIYLPSMPFMWLAGIVLLLAAWEWTRLAGCESLWGRAISLLSIVFIPYLCYLIINYLILNEQQQITVFDAFIFLKYLSIVTWCFASLTVLCYPKGTMLYRSKIIGTLIGSCLLIPTYAVLILLQESAFVKYVSLTWVLYPLVLVWVADISAYFVGRRFGRHKLAPKISVGKTWEGVVGAFLGVALFSVIGYYFLFIIEIPHPVYRHVSLFSWIIFSLILAAFSIIGDLFESLFKRMRNLKDSGNILPGHGGIMDRIDSLTAVLPLFMVGLMLLGR